MKKLTIIAFAAAGIMFSSCHSTDKKTNRVSDTDAAKGSGGAADTTKVVDSSSAPGISTASPGTTDTSKTGRNSAAPASDSVKN